jgi:hypothetical protein
MDGYKTNTKFSFLYYECFIMHYYIAETFIFVVRYVVCVNIIHKSASDF